jgi:uncharacterized protein (TIGR02594 family)
MWSTNEMTITRIFTDVTEDQLGPLVAAIRADNGSFTQIKQEKSLFTVTARLPFEPPEEEPPLHVAEYPWMAIARAEMGVTRASDPARIEQYLETTGVVSDADVIPWCSAFVNFCVSRGGLDGTNSALARSWLRWGMDAGGLVPGCIVVLSRGTPPKGHVGFFIGADQDYVRLLGGNQHDSVNEAHFPRDRIIGARKPRV